MDIEELDMRKKINDSLPIIDQLAEDVLARLKGWELKKDNLLNKREWSLSLNNFESKKYYF